MDALWDFGTKTRGCCSASAVVDGGGAKGEEVRMGSGGCEKVDGGWVDDFFFFFFWVFGT